MGKGDHDLLLSASPHILFFTPFRAARLCLQRKRCGSPGALFAVDNLPAALYADTKAVGGRQRQRGLDSVLIEMEGRDDSF